MAVRTISNYEIGETLGVGGFSKVKLGTHVDTGERVALKILQKNRISMKDSSLRQVHSEIEAMSKVNHKNVIRLKEVDLAAQYPKSNGSKEEVMLVILELAQGGEFFDFLSFTGSFEEKIARTYFTQLVDGLEACHKSGVAHRDIKPENLLLDDKFVLKLADFGFSKVVQSDDDLMRTECGTRGYMAPEILRHNQYTTSTDIFASGVVLFIMLAGFPPFQIATRQDWWFHKLLTGRHALFWEAHQRAAYFSEDAKDFINKILDPNPKTRLTLDQIKSHQWFTGQTMSDDVMFRELSQRKKTVDEEKEAERRKRQTVNLDTTAHRGVDTESYGDLPSHVPDFGAFMGGATVDAVLEGGVKVPTSPTGGSPKSPAPEPVEFNPKHHILGYTHFHSTLSAKGILHRVCQAVNSAQGSLDYADDKLYKIKAKVMGEAGITEFVAQVFKDSEHDSNFVIFKRRQGDPMEYRKLYQTMNAQLADIIVTPTKAEEEKENA